MNLSDRANLYLSNFFKDVKWSASKDETAEYLTAQNIFPTQHILDFQAHYSGLNLTIAQDSKNTFRTFLFSKEQILEKELLIDYKVNGKIFFSCGDLSSAPFLFYLTVDGEICTIDDMDNINIIHSNIEVLIEQYALLNKFSDWKQHPEYFKLLQKGALDDFMKSSFHFIEETSDDYSLWWQNEILLVTIGTWFDKPSKYLHVYGKNQKIISKLIQTLEEKAII